VKNLATTGLDHQLVIFELLLFQHILHVLLLPSSKVAYFDLFDDGFKLDGKHDDHVEQHERAKVTNIDPADLELAVHIRQPLVVLGIAWIGHLHQPITVDEQEVATL